MNRPFAFASRTLVPILAATCWTSLPAPAGQAGGENCPEATAGTATCKWVIEKKWKTKYRRTFLKVVTSGFGLFGSTRTCYQVEEGYSKYEYQGPPIAFGPLCSTPAPTQQHDLATGYTLRFLNGEANCYGDPVAPDTSATLGALRYVALDGQVLELSFVPTAGRLSHFLGRDFDAAPFDPAFLSFDSWTGYEAVIPTSVVVPPTLTLQVGGDPLVPVQGLMNLQQPDPKVLAVDLGPAAAHSLLSLVVSDTTPGDGPLLAMDGVTVPIVPDAYTLWFEQSFPTLVAVADAQGMAWIPFPLLDDLSLEGVDLNVAVVARDPAGLRAIASTTFVNIQLRDLDFCPKHKLK